MAVIVGTSKNVDTLTPPERLFRIICGELLEASRIREEEIKSQKKRPSHRTYDACSQQAGVRLSQKGMACVRRLGLVQKDIASGLFESGVDDSVTEGMKSLPQNNSQLCDALIRAFFFVWMQKVRLIEATLNRAATRTEEREAYYAACCELGIVVTDDNPNLLPDSFLKKASQDQGR